MNDFYVTRPILPLHDNGVHLVDYIDTRIEALRKDLYNYELTWSELTSIEDTIKELNALRSAFFGREFTEEMSR